MKKSQVVGNIDNIEKEFYSDIKNHKAIQAVLKYIESFDGDHELTHSEEFHLIQECFKNKLDQDNPHSRFYVILRNFLHQIESENQCYGHLNKSLEKLFDNNYLTEETYSGLLSYCDPEIMVRIFLLLKNANIIFNPSQLKNSLQQETYRGLGEELVTYRSEITLLSILQNLHDSDSLTQENFDALNPACLSRSLNSDVWDLIPKGELTSSAFKHILTIVSDYLTQKTESSSNRDEHSAENKMLTKAKYAILIIARNALLETYAKYCAALGSSNAQDCFTHDYPGMPMICCTDLLADLNRAIKTTKGEGNNQTDLRNAKTVIFECRFQMQEHNSNDSAATAAKAAECS